ncbi:hypothetical protein J3458_002166 [Metarhizium acridum]|uniref:uncharacterized protein n=1 Tax=Metarhizium acridum TaxID=92637 RepID=UPI001C6C5D29|nr:hypothetical protein J3458_002166 [Metarhizium acridum]
MESAFPFFFLSRLTSLVFNLSPPSGLTRSRASSDQNRGECDSKAGVAVGSSSYMSQGKDAITPYKDMMVPLVVTAGADKLSPAPGATQTGNVPAATGSAGASRASLATRSGSTSASTTSATAANAAGAMVPRNLGPAGVAAVTGGAMLLL